MKAIVVRHPGGPEVLEYTDVPTPTVKPGWSLIKVKGFGINHSEIFTRQGQSPDVQFPRILGIEVVGEVAESTDDNLRVGQKVIFIMGEMGRAFDGGYAEYVLLPNHQIYPVQTTLDWPILAAIPETYYTAFGIFRSLQVRPNERVLIRGASSGVGIAVMRLIKSIDYDVQIVGTTRSEAKVQLLQEVGFNEVIVTGNDLPANIGEFDKIVDLIGPLTLRDSLKHLVEFGIVSSTCQLGGQWTLDEFDPITDIPNNRYLTGFYSGDVSQYKIQQMLDFIQLHPLNLSPDKAFTLSEISQAHKYLENSQNLGKIVVML